MTTKKKKMAVILCGSGYLDGSEIREAVGVLWALSAQPEVETQCFAPDADQWDVVNHLAAQPASSGEKRNMLLESARIARGKVRPLSEFKADEFDGILMPGGFGVAKTLCTFAREGSKGTVRADLEKALLDMNRAGKPIGAVCISPAVVALTFGKQKKALELTVGAAGEAAQEIEKLGHRHIVCPANACHIDAKNRIVSTPAYMYDDAPLHEIFEGIRKLVTEVVRLTG